MKYTIPVLLLALVVGVLAGTQKNRAAEGSEATTQALIEVENKWVEALVKSDNAVLDSLFADTYVDTDERGHRSSKQEVISVLKSGELKFQSINLSDMHVNAYGDTAVVIGTAAQVGNFRGQPLAATIIFTDTFIKQNGKWRAVASHRSAV
jgi:hypothetical protein